MIASTAAAAAVRRLDELIMNQPVGGSGSSRSNGWLVEVEVIEEHRVPVGRHPGALRDRAGRQGDLLAFPRTKRYARGKSGTTTRGLRDGIGTTGQQVPGRPRGAERRVLEPRRHPRRVLDKGLVIAGDIQVNLLDIELLTIKLRLVIASLETAREVGINWWESDPWLTGDNGKLRGKPAVSGPASPNWKGAGGPRGRRGGR